MNIPKRFKLLDHTIDVEVNNDLLAANNAYGTCNYVEKKVKIQNKGIKKSQVDHTFMHELVHLILDTMGETELKENEKFVDVFSGLLSQAMNTMETK